MAEVLQLKKGSGRPGDGDANDGGSVISASKALLFCSNSKQHLHLMNIMRICGLKNVVGVDNLEKAIHQIISNRFDLVLVSHSGEARDASRLVEDLKGHDATADIPIIAITSGGNVNDSLRIMAKGVDEVLSEPISAQEIEAKIRKVLATDDGTDIGKEAMRRADNFLAEGRIDEAVTIYDRLRHDHERGLAANLGLFEARLRREDWEQALAALKRAVDIAKASGDKIQLHRNMAETFYHYGRYYEARKALKKAAKSYRTALKLNPFNLDNTVALLLLLQKEDELEEIISVVQEAAGAYLPYSQPLETIALSLSDMLDRFLSLGLAQHADKLAKVMTGLKHENSDVHLKVTGYFMDQGQVKTVVRNLVEVCGRIKDPDLLTTLGKILMDNDADTMWAGYDLSQTALGRNLEEADGAHKSLALAKQVFHQAMLLEPDNPGHRLGLAGCELRMGNVDQAASVLDKIKEGDLDDLGTYLQIIESLLAEQAYDLAGQWLKDAGRAFPDDAQVAQLQARFHLDRGKPTEAITALKKGLSKNPEDGDMLLMLAETYLAEGENSDAAFYFEKAAKALPDNEQVKEGLAKALGGR